MTREVVWGTRDRFELLSRLAGSEARIAELEGELAALSREDAVTALPSVPVFHARLADEVARARRHHRPLALLLIEPDDLDAFRAARGFAAADERLRDVARALRRLVRAADCLHRGPGDTFAVVMPEAVRAGSRTGSARLLAEVEKVCPASAGLACWEENQGAEALEAAALAALAQARVAGRGLVVLGGDPSPAAAETGPHEGIEALAVALLERDRHPAELSGSVPEMAAGLARALEVDEPEIDRIRAAALLHDIGKVAIPDSILHKAGPLDRAEWEVIRRHPVIGERILLAVPGLGGVARIVRHEHEFFDGTGYPDGTEGECIPIGARILLVCVAYHAMTSERPYRRALRPEAALAEITRGAGTQFDPAVVEALTDWVPGPERMDAALA